MKITCGTDIIEIDRIKQSIEDLGDKFLKRVYTDREIEYCEGKNMQRYQHYAARFAAKEAFSKALGTGITGFNLKDVFITNDQDGKPTLNIQNNAKNILENRCGACKVLVSLSHEKEFAIAFVIIECV